MAKRGLFYGKAWLFAAALGGWLTPAAARAATYNYVDWTAADVAGGTAEGTITLPDNSTVTVTFAAINENQTAGTLYGAQTSGGTNYWNPSAPYISTQVENAPPTPDILQLEGGLNQTYRVTLSEPIKDPIMAIVSLGAAGVTCSYDFDAPFTIVSQGAGYWGGNDMALKVMPEDVLQGQEGHGTIQFIGTFATFSWTVPTPEGWHGFTFGIRTTERLEPTPDAGGAGGGANEAGAGPSQNGGAPSEMGGTGPDQGEAGAIGEGPAGAAAGGESSSGGSPNTTGGKPSTGGSSILPSGGDALGGAPEDDGRGITKHDAGCGCSVPQGSGGSVAALGLLLLTVASRRARKRQ